MAKRVSVPISTARKQLFDLADLVRTSDDTVVVLEQRGGVERVAMVREARLAYLEARVAELAGRDRPAFQLAGSLSSDLEDEALERSLRELRLEWSAGRSAAARSVNAGRRRTRRG
jgi:hypothetical protein